MGSQASGRRIALHEYPKADTPYAEDMGRKARRWTVSAYIIGPTYFAGRDALIAVCEQEGNLSFVHPTLGSNQVVVDGYKVEESRERGGYAAFELSLLEAGQPATYDVTDDTQSQAVSAAENSDAASANSLNTSLSGAPASSADPASAVGAGGTNNAGFGTVPSNGFSGVPLTNATGF